MALRFQSVFWATRDSQELAKKLSKMGFNVGPSMWDPGTRAVFFGPEAIEIFGQGDKLVTLADQSQAEEFTGRGDGIFGIGLESDDIVSDYARIKGQSPELEKPRRAQDSDKGVPLWFGFSLPKNLSPMLKAWAMMYAPAVLSQQAREKLPATHPNTCFGLEAVHVVTKDPEPVSAQWGQLMERHVSGLHWKELAETQGKRIQAGERFFDVLSSKGDGPLMQASHGREGVFMLTLKVEDLERAKRICEDAGAKVMKCHNRDGFIVPSDFTGGPALRFVRAFWKRYLPLINENYPSGRRADKYRPLGGANSTTLETGFADDWRY